MENVVNEIKNWHLFTDVFGEEYEMHDAVIKRFDLNGNELTVVVNTLYEIAKDKVYDITLRFSNLISLDYDTEIGNDYIYGLYVNKDNYFKNLYHVTFESVALEIVCFTMELVSIEESEPFQRSLISLSDPEQTADNGSKMWRT